ncbi:MAG: TraR/DksA C4-type zinc finger protein [Bacteroidales bacterium]|nr:TraR/DksA C4-type zinc finger protein [Bacteroidales bacterium]
MNKPKTITASEKNLILEKLKKEKVKLDRTIHELRELTQPIAPDDSIGRISRMDAINNRSVNEAALRKTVEKLKTINFAIDDIDKPYFGHCRKCGEPIPFGRLMVMPGSSTCVGCAGMAIG